MILKDAIDQGVFKIDDTQYTDADFQAMTVDQLETVKLRINKNVSRLSAALREMQADYSSGSPGADKDQYLSRKNAMSINQRVLTYVNFLLRKKRIRSSKTISDYFRDQAKKYLTPEEFKMIMNSASREMRLAGGQ